MAVVDRLARVARPRAEAPSLHAIAWLVWLGGACVVAFLTSNPLYLSIAFLSATLVLVSVPESPKKRMMRAVVLVGVAVSALSIPLNVLTGSTGSTELASVPELTFPAWLGGVTFGGAITAEALVAAVTRALTIAALIVVSGAFNAAVDHYQLVRLAPKVLAPAMLVTTIALQVVPAALDHGKNVAEARRLRGRSGRGFRTVPALLLPVLEGALERSIQRAESLEARGLGGRTTGQQQWRSLVGVAGVGLLAWGAFAAYYRGVDLLLVAPLMCGAGLVLFAMLRSGEGSTTHLRAPARSSADLITVAATLTSVGLMLSLRAVDGGDVSYLPYPDARLPGFSLPGALSVLLIAVPALFAGRATHDHS